MRRTREIIRKHARRRESAAQSNAGRSDLAVNPIAANENTPVANEQIVLKPAS